MAEVVRMDENSSRIGPTGLRWAKMRMGTRQRADSFLSVAAAVQRGRRRPNSRTQGTWRWCGIRKGEVTFASLPSLFP